MAAGAALRRFDRRATLGEAGIGPGTLLLEDVDLPSRGMRAGRVYAFWHMDGLSPALDSILIPGCEMHPSPSAGAGGGGGGGDFPATRLDSALIVSGRDSVLFQGRISRSGGVTEARGILSGSWGSAALSTGGSGGATVLECEFTDCTRVPLAGIELPGPVAGPAFSGTLSGGFSGDSARLCGTVTAIDGTPASIPFTIERSGTTSRLLVSTDLSAAGGFAAEWLRSFDPEAEVLIEPTGSLELDYGSDGRCGIRLEAAVAGGVVESSMLADGPVVLDCSLSIAGTLRDGAFTTESGLLVIGSIPLEASLAGTADRLELRLRNDSIPAGVIAGSIPSALAGPLEGTRLSGSLSLDAYLLLDRSCPDSSDIRIDVDASRLSVDWCPVRVSPFREGGSCLMTDSWGNEELIGLDRMTDPGFLPADSFPPWFEPLLCSAEDGSFRTHRGFSPDQIRGALIDDLRAGRFVRGASTLTMQLARNLFLGRDRTVARKFQEVFLTWRLETTLGKDRILEIYANIVELGPGVFGFEQASRHYFGCGFADLGVRETAFLVSILPGPGVYHSYYESGSVPDHWEEYLDLLIGCASRRTGRDLAAGAPDRISFAR
jgi:hypothetical protein